jgi:predicted house-cleaning NTP pyrophosphatase (Maf/HAM1 superfamily)
VAHDGEPPLHYVERIARTKAAVAAQQLRRRGLPPRPVLGADTEGRAGRTIFGKPRDASDAARMLALLSGRTHQVSTAVAVADGDQVHAEILTFDVTLCELTRKRSAATSQPANPQTRQALAIQGRAAAFVSPYRGKLHRRNGPSALRDLRHPRSDSGSRAIRAATDPVAGGPWRLSGECSAQYFRTSHETAPSRCHMRFSSM